MALRGVKVFKMEMETERSAHQVQKDQMVSQEMDRPMENEQVVCPNSVTNVVPNIPFLLLNIVMNVAHEDWEQLVHS